MRYDIGMCSFSFVSPFLGDRERNPSLTVLDDIESAEFATSAKRVEDEDVPLQKFRRRLREAKIRRIRQQAKSAEKSDGGSRGSIRNFVGSLRMGGASIRGSLKLHSFRLKRRGSLISVKKPRVNNGKVQASCCCFCC